MVPTIEPRTEISTGEGRGREGDTIRTVSVEVGPPAVQSLENYRELGEERSFIIKDL